MRTTLKQAAVRTLLTAVFTITGCLHTVDRAAIFTEEGLTLANDQWDQAYNDKLSACEQLHPPETPEAELCFGEFYDADGQVELAVRSAVVILRAYWIARAAGQRPDWREVMKQVATLMDALPPQAKTYFDRVKGL